MSVMFKGKNFDENSWQIISNDGQRRLLYAGQERDGKKVPNLADLHDLAKSGEYTDWSHLCEGSDLEVGIPLVEGVKKTDYMNAGCVHMLVASDMVDTVESSQGMYDGAVNLTTPSKISEQCKNINAMYANCESLEKVSVIPDSVIDAESYAEGCSSIDSISGGKNVQNAKYIAAGCSNLRMIDGLNPKADMTDAFTGAGIDLDKVNELLENYAANETVKTEDLNREALSDELIAGLEGEASESLDFDR